MTQKCEHCVMPIKILKTIVGNEMPVDPTPRLYWVKEKGKSRVVTPQGEIFDCEYEDNDSGGMADGYGYTPHYASCSYYKHDKKD